MEKIQIKLFEDETKNLNKMLRDVNKFLIDNNLSLININEIRYAYQGVLHSRIVIYYLPNLTNEIITPIGYDFIEILLDDYYTKAPEILNKKIETLKDKFKDNLDLIFQICNITESSYNLNTIIWVRINIFYTFKKK